MPSKTPEAPRRETSTATASVGGRALERDGGSAGGALVGGVGGARSPPCKSIQAIGAAGGAAEHRKLLALGRAGGDALERVPQRRVADAHLLDGVVALEHAAARAEALDAGLEIRPPVVRQLGRGRGRRQRAVVVC